MPQIATVEKFIQAVETEPHDLVVERYYTEDATMQENQNPPRVGRAAHVAHERDASARAHVIHSQCIRPFFIQGDEVIIRWKFRFEWKNDTITEIEEVAVQLWEGERIRQEQFFYDPKQFAPRPRE